MSCRIVQTVDNMCVLQFCRAWWISTLELDDVNFVLAGCMRTEVSRYSLLMSVN